MPETEDARARLLEKANSLPMTPGVYLMKDAAGKVIYVGKSRKLHNRVSQYFQNSEKSIKTGKMVAKVYDFDYILCQTEIEALSLENTLIKQYSPKYNIRLKDAKSYPYIKITNEEYPQIRFTRTREADRAKYFGPYSGVSVVFSVLGTLRKTLGLPTCTHRFPEDIGKIRPCLYYQMHKCCGLCTGNVSAAEYRELVQITADVLRGNTAQAKKRLEEEMYGYAEQEQYEAAARCRDAIKALEKLSQKQYVVSDPDTDQDVIALYEDGLTACISVFYVRHGTVVDQAAFLPGPDSVTDGESIVSFLEGQYRLREDIPPQILMSFELEEELAQEFSADLFGLCGHRVEVRTPERGPARKLCETVLANAKETAEHWEKDSSRDESVLARLAQLLSLEVYPARIESYDISNYGKEQLTAGMVVIEDGKFKKSDYRTFRIRSVEGTDDYASMYEALDRRLARIEEGDEAFGPAPDLILLDGGRTHVATVNRCMQAHHLDIPVFGMVKDDYHKTRALCTEDGEISIAKERDLFVFIYKIQEEVHRFSVSRMKAGKSRTLKHSSLEKIPGIGAAKAAALQKHFKTLQKLREASPEQIAAVGGISQKNAQDVFDYLHRKD
ncbi:MAG: excinuclease ABC subunit UvrC [Clostridia bacterium]|nr:excinuclease ABC subunit UvrC [Clostridia bacterium]